MSALPPTVKQQRQININLNIDQNWVLHFEAASGNRQLIGELIVKLVDQTLRFYTPEMSKVFLDSIDGSLREASLAGYARGVKAGARRVELSADAAAEIGKALGSAIANLPAPAVTVQPAQPVVHVAAPTVTVENHVEVPQRPVKATMQPDGSVLMVAQA